MSTCKTANRSAACAVFVLMLGGCATEPPVTERWGPPPVGATWESAQKNTGSFGSDRQVKSTRLPDATWKGGTAIVVANAAGGKLLMTMDGGRWIAFLGPDGTPAVTFDPPIGWAYPLAVGKSFDMSYKMTNAKGAVTEVVGSCAVEAWERVEVRAGSFDAYRIACKNSLGEDGTYWSSSTGAFIKTRLQRPASHPMGAGTQETELLKAPS
jgi:hypothetical protein